jgi:hypothetical protein
VAVRFTDAGPVPESGDTASQAVFWLAGNTETIHGCPEGKLTLMLVAADCDGPALMATELFEVARAPGLLAGL